MEQIRDSEDFKETVIKVKSGPKKGQQGEKVFFKEDGSLDALISRFLERLNFFWIPYMSGCRLVLIKPIRDIRISKEPSGMSKTAQKGPKR